MKKLILLLSLVGMLWSCKKTNEPLSETKEKGNIGSKYSSGKISSAADGLWDVLGYGYDVTGQYANSQSAKFSIINVEKLELEHPTYVENSGAETGTSIFEVGQNAEDFSRKLATKVNIKGGADLLFKGTIDANFDIENKWSSKYVYSTYSSVAIKRRVYVLNDVNVLKNYLHQDFLNNVQTYSAQQLVSLYGTHVLTDIKLGGKIELIYQSETSSSDRIIAAGAGATASFQKIFSLTTTTTYNSTDHKNNFNEKAFVRTIGGNSSEAIFTTITFNSTGTPSSSFNLAPWQSGITDANAELIDITPGGLIPIYDLIADPVKALQVKDYVTQYLSDNQVISQSEPIYTFYNSIRKDYALSPNLNTPNLYPGWVYNDKPFNGFISNTSGTVPVYQFVNNANGDHAYSTSSSNTYPGWVYETIPFYAYGSQINGSIPIYQFYHSANTAHLYSSNRNATIGYSGWVYQGIVFYALPSN